MPARGARSMRTRPFLIAMALAATGCAPPGFARLGPFQVVFADGGEVGERAFLSYADQERGCQRLDDFTATANGRNAETSLGEGFFGFDFQPHCLPPIVDFFRPQSPADDMTLELSSGEDRVIATIEGLGRTIVGQL